MMSTREIPSPPTSTFPSCAIAPHIHFCAQHTRRTAAPGRSTTMHPLSYSSPQLHVLCMNRWQDAQSHVEHSSNTSRAERTAAAAINRTWIRAVGGPVVYQARSSMTAGSDETEMTPRSDDDGASDPPMARRTAFDLALAALPPLQRQTLRLLFTGASINLVSEAVGVAR